MIMLSPISLLPSSVCGPVHKAPDLVVWSRDISVAQAARNKEKWIAPALA